MFFQPPWWWYYQTLPRDGGLEKLHGDPTVGPRPKIWTRDKKWPPFQTLGSEILDTMPQMKLSVLVFVNSKSVSFPQQQFVVTATQLI